MLFELARAYHVELMTNRWLTQDAVIRQGASINNQNYNLKLSDWHHETKDLNRKSNNYLEGNPKLNLCENGI